MRLIVWIWATLLIFNSLVAAEEKTEPCQSFMTEVRDNYGSPQRMEKVDGTFSKQVIWYYPDQGFKESFTWSETTEVSGSDIVCTLENTVIPLSKKGLAVRVKEIQKDHPGWSQKAYRAIVEKKVFIGMSRNQVVASWGDPDRVNRSIGMHGQNEQWIYKNEYLYFDDGRLSSMQLSR